MAERWRRGGAAEEEEDGCRSAKDGSGETLDVAEARVIGVMFVCELRGGLSPPHLAGFIMLIFPHS